MKKLAAVFTALLMLVAGAAVSAGCGDTRETFDGVVVVNNGDAIYHEDAMKEGAEEPVHLKIGFTEAGFGREWIVELSKAFVRENKDVYIELEGDPVLASSLFTKLDTGKNLADIFIPLNSAWVNKPLRR